MALLTPLAIQSALDPMALLTPLAMQSWNGVDQLQILRSIKIGVFETSSSRKTGSQLYNTAPVLQMPN